jgi:uncharacterized protein YbaR (Trm112 family)
LTFDTALLDIVCCPVTRLPLQLMPPNRAQRLNASIDEGQIKNRAGAVVDERCEQWLITRDAKLANPVRDGIPVLIEDHGVELSQLQD